ncbi:MAG: alpha/beta fold hydrolase, partial [Rubripirellula sp.]|nr:alpha/beta fold hydrolase [Rubripirellula sp.]
DMKPGEQRPGIVGMHPTGAAGKGCFKSWPLCNFPIELAMLGYVVNVPDYPGFGDSRPYNFESDRYDSGTIKGVFNHMTCVDLLQAHPDVDPNKIGAIGHSLGGHSAMFLAALTIGARSRFPVMVGRHSSITKQNQAVSKRGHCQRICRRWRRSINRITDSFHLIFMKWQRPSHRECSFPVHQLATVSFPDGDLKLPHLLSKLSLKRVAQRRLFNSISHSPNIVFRGTRGKRRIGP